jgi:hypothetical protein
VITYESASNTYKPKPGASTGSVYQTTKFAADFQFSATPTADLLSPGAKTVTLASCPAGVRGDDADYWVYVSGTGTAEAVKVTGGTCVGDLNSGTLQFTTANGHATGYAITSASAGIAEASIAARYRPRGVGLPSGGTIIARVARRSPDTSDQRSSLMGAATLISLVLTLLQSILASARVGGLAPDVIANIEAAVTNLLAVQGTPVTFAHLEGLRVTTKW